MMILRPILDPKIGTIRRLKSERLIGIAEYIFKYSCTLFKRAGAVPKWPLVGHRTRRQHAAHSRG